jgi:pyruvate formate lyase activating enzyme
MIDPRGWVKTSLIDFPGHIATVLFTGGCNFRCPMCHNGDLVLHPGSLPAIDFDTVRAFLRRRAGLITGVVITGGEPTLRPGLARALSEIRDLGYAVKLDTNGYEPDVLATLLDQRLLDFVAMDVKGSPATYGRLAGLPDLDLARIEASLSLLCCGAVSAEFRTTVVPGLLDAEAIEAIARWLADFMDGGCRAPYVLQQFRGQQTLDQALGGVSPYGVATLDAMAERARRWLEDVRLRGV